MTNKQIVSYILIAFAFIFTGGFIEGYNGYSDGLSALFLIVGIFGYWVFFIWGLIRLWKTNIEK